MKSDWAKDRLATLVLLIPLGILSLFMDVGAVFYTIYAGICAAIVSGKYSPELNDSRVFAAFVLTSPVGLLLFHSNEKASLFFGFFFCWGAAGLLLALFYRKKQRND